jgi:hypothetical protein
VREGVARGAKARADDRRIGMIGAVRIGGPYMHGATVAKRSLQLAVEFDEDVRSYSPKRTTIVLRSGLNNETKPDLSKLSPQQLAQHLSKLAVESLIRYGGNPDLLLKENPHRDFRNPPKK